MNWGTVAVCAACFAAGAGLAHYKGAEALAQARLEAAIVRANDGRESYAKLVAAQNALDALRADADRVRLDLDRVRRAESERAARASASACDVERAAVSRCENLLRESAELLSEARSLLDRNAAIHDAAIRAIE